MTRAEVQVEPAATQPPTMPGSPGRLLAPRSRLELLAVLAGGLLVALAWINQYAAGPAWAMWLLCALSVPCTCPRTLRRAMEALRALRIDVDVLMFIAAAGAAAIGRPVEGAFLLFLFGLGAVGEHLAMQRAEQSLKSLEALAPEHAERLQPDGSVETVALSRIAVGDVLRVRPFERFACDGTVIEGTTAVDQSTLTGEAVPVERGPGDEVLAGTMNTGAAITMRVTRPTSESALARVIQVVTTARSRRARVEMLTRRIERWYAPSILVASTIVFVLPWALGEPAAEWFYRSMAFLTAASPCALAIGAPATYLCGIAAGARRGIVFKGGESIESLAKISAIAFDKTGTITTGKPRVRAVTALEGDENDVVAFAAALESQASHPLADAIVLEAERRSVGIPLPENVRQLPGLGVEGEVDGQAVRVGSPKLIEAGPGLEAAREAIHHFAQAGATVVVVEVGGRIRGIIGIGDRLRSDAARAMAEFARRGLRLVMITGDHAESARAIAGEIGIEEVHADQSPQDKMDLLEQLEREMGSVAMIGDGANDAPALARATVSLSMGGAASDVAADNADIAIMGEKMMAIADAIDVAKRAARIMRQNLVIALAVIVIVAPLAIAGVADLGPAVVLHEGSTVVVVLNALRQLRGRSVRH